MPWVPVGFDALSTSSGLNPRTLTVATTSSRGVRTLAPIAAANSADVNKARSTGTMLERWARYTVASFSTSDGGGESDTNRRHSLVAMRLAVAGCMARWSRKASAAEWPPAGVLLGWRKPAAATG